MRFHLLALGMAVAASLTAAAPPVWAVGSNMCASKTSIQLAASSGAIALGQPTTVSWNYSAPDDCLPTTLRIHYTDSLTGIAMHTDVTDRSEPPSGSLVDHPQDTGWYSLEAYAGGSPLTIGHAAVQVALPTKNGHPSVDITQSNQNGLFAQAISLPNAVVSIASTLDLDLSGMSFLQVASGVSILGDTSVNRAGPRLFTTTFPDTLLQVGTTSSPSNNVHISGIRLDGGMSDDAYSAVGKNDANGIVVDSSQSVEIDHNEIHHWRGAGVRVLDGNSVINRANANTVQVHDNFIHHNQHPASSNCLSAAVGDSHAAGYGVEAADGAYVTIERNVFDWNRHAISGDGKEGTGYIADDNLILQHGGVHFRCLQSTSDVWDVVDAVLNPFPNILELGWDLLDGDHNYHTHMIDMHARNDCWPGTYNCGPAGEFMEIDNNTILYTAGNDIHLRGTPAVEMFVHDNVFAQETHSGGINEVGALDQNEHGLHAINNTFGLNTFDDRKSCDFDGDGVSDPFVATGIAWWFSASTLNGRWIFLQRSPTRVADVQLRDVDGDGRCDVVTADGTFLNHDAQPLAVSPGDVSSPVATPFALDLNATGGSKPFTWQVAGLPSGLVANSAGHISGSAAADGPVTSTVTATVTGATGLRSSVSFAWTLTTRVPDLRGQPQSLAPNSLAPVGLHLGNVSLVRNCTLEPGVILGQSPAAGSIVPQQSAVSISVSSLSDSLGHRCKQN
jgi:hypothetical protein